MLVRSLLPVCCVGVDWFLFLCVQRFGCGQCSCPIDSCLGLASTFVVFHVLQLDSVEVDLKICVSGSCVRLVARTGCLGRRLQFIALDLAQHRVSDIYFLSACALWMVCSFILHTGIYHDRFICSYLFQRNNHRKWFWFIKNIYYYSFAILKFHLIKNGSSKEHTFLLWIFVH